MVSGRYTAFSNNKKMVPILQRELERKAEKAKHMKLAVMRPLKRMEKIRRENAFKQKKQKSGLKFWVSADRLLSKEL